MNLHNFIIPSIDLLDESIVRLYKGDYGQKTVYNVNLSDLLEKYKHFSNLHIVDLNGAKGDGMKNIALIAKIRHNFAGKIQLGGGIRSIDVADQILNLTKINAVVIGTIAINNPDLTMKMIEKFGKEKVVLAIDCLFDGQKFIPKANGWVENSDNDLFSLLEIYQNSAKNLLITDISVDGTMSGANVELYRQIKEKFPNFKVQASGGVSSIENVQALQKVTDFAIVGKALYENIFDDLC